MLYFHIDKKVGVKHNFPNPCDPFVLEAAGTSSLFWASILHAQALSGWCLTCAAAQATEVPSTTPGAINHSAQRESWTHGLERLRWLGPWAAFLRAAQGAPRRTQPRADGDAPSSVEETKWRATAYWRTSRVTWRGGCSRGTHVAACLLLWKAAWYTGQRGTSVSLCLWNCLEELRLKKKMPNF